MKSAPLPLPESLWIDAFANELGRLLPSMTAEEATQRARETWADASDLSPQEAAEIYAEELPPGAPGAPGD